MRNVDFADLKKIDTLTGIEDILKQPVIHDAILIGVTDPEGIKEMKDEGFVPLGWDVTPLSSHEQFMKDLEVLHYGTEEDHEDRQTGGSEDETQG